MTEEIEFKGKWFLPSEINNKIFGVVKFIPHKGNTLELFGAFKSHEYSKLQFIWGILPTGECVTLHNCFVTNYSMNSSNGFNLTTYHVNFLFHGAHFKNLRALAFNKINIQLSNLDSWLNLSGFENQRSEDRREVNIKYKLPHDISFSLDTTTTFSIKNSYQIPSKNQRQEMTIKQYSYIQLEYKRKKKFKEILKDITHIQNLFVLFMQNPTLIESIDLKFKIGNKKVFHNSKLYFSLLKPRYGKEYLHWIDMVISYKNISNDFEKIIKKWMDLRENLNTVFNPYFSIYHSPFFYMSDMYLNLARAIEAFHRETINNNHVHYKTRVKEVLEKYSKCYNGLLKIKSKGKFAKRVKDLRNLFTHSNPLETDSNKYSLELYHYSERLQIILACAIMSFMGLDEKLIKKNIESTRRYTHIKYKIK